MLVKYLGEGWEETQYSKNYNLTLRHQFLLNGMFRATQPCNLNDPSGEGKFNVFFNEYSDADIEWALNKHKNSPFNDGGILTREELINFYLRPTGLRYTLESFPSLKGFEEFQDFETTEEYDLYVCENKVREINDQVVKKLSNHLGILSLSKTFDNENMWLKYANHGTGLVIIFNEQHLFFHNHPAKEVMYGDAKRASLTYIEGTWRLNGAPIKEEYNKLNPDNLIKHLSNELNQTQLIDRLFFTKDTRWEDEQEIRIIFNLDDCEEMITEKIQDKLNQFLRVKDPQGIYLKKIPFEAFDTLVLGYRISEENKQALIRLVSEQPHLSHLKIKQVKHNIITRKLMIVDL